MLVHAICRTTGRVWLAGWDFLRDFDGGSTDSRGKNRPPLPPTRLLPVGEGDIQDGLTYTTARPLNQHTEQRPPLYPILCCIRLVIPQQPSRLRRYWHRGDPEKQRDSGAPLSGQGVVPRCCHTRGGKGGGGEKRAQFFRWFIFRRPLLFFVQGERLLKEKQMSKKETVWSLGGVGSPSVVPAIRTGPRSRVRPLHSHLHGCGCIPAIGNRPHEHNYYSTLP